MATRAWAGAAVVASLAGLLSSFALDRLAPFPAADVARGSEDAFVSGLYPREFAGAGAARRLQRWTGGRVEIRFLDLPQGARRLEVAVRQHRQPVAVAADGVLLGSLPPGVDRAELALPATQRSSVSVELRTETFVAGDGRALGAYFERVSLQYERAVLPPAGLLAGGVLTALGALGAAAAGGLSPLAAALSAVAVGLVRCALLWPCGLVRSSYAHEASLLLVFGCGLAAAFGRWRAARSGSSEAARWTFAALLLAFAWQAVVLTSPMVVMSDAVFHANKLRQVAGGDWFPVSQTQHAVPFRFPYAVAFYAALSPLARAGFDPVSLVRHGAGIAGVGGAAALLLMAGRKPRQAALALLVLLAMPISADVFSYGNLSNVFGQAAMLAFVSWWIAPRGGALLGAALLAVTALSHLSSAIVVAALVPALLVSGRPLLRVGRGRLLAALAGAVFAALYYAHFVPLMLEQLPRLAEGGGSGRRTLSLLPALAGQAERALGQWGWPAVLLAVLGMPRAQGELERTLLATWWTGGLLALVAAVSPLEVRYLYAMSFAVALAAAAGAARLASRGRVAGAAAGLLVAAQVAFALRDTLEIVLHRYRP